MTTIESLSTSRQKQSSCIESIGRSLSYRHPDSNCGDRTTCLSAWNQASDFRCCWRCSSIKLTMTSALQCARMERLSSLIRGCRQYFCFFRGDTWKPPLLCPWVFPPDWTEMKRWITPEDFIETLLNWKCHFSRQLPTEAREIALFLFSAFSFLSLSQTSMWHSTIRLGLVRVFYPCLMVFGTIGNILCLKILLRKRFRRQSTCQYLCILAVIDILFIYMRSTRYLYRHIFDADLRNASLWICRTYIFFSSTLSHLASWILVIVSFDRFLTMKNLFPRRRAGWRVIKSTCILIFIVCMLNAHYFYILGKWLEERTIEDSMGFDFRRYSHQTTNSVQSDWSESFQRVLLFQSAFRLHCSCSIQAFLSSLLADLRPSLRGDDSVSSDGLRQYRHHSQDHAFEHVVCHITEAKAQQSLDDHVTFGDLSVYSSHVSIGDLHLSESFELDDEFLGHETSRPGSARVSLVHQTCVEFHSLHFERTRLSARVPQVDLVFASIDTEYAAQSTASSTASGKQCHFHAFVSLVIEVAFDTHAVPSVYQQWRLSAQKQSSLNVISQSRSRTIDGRERK